MESIITCLALALAMIITYGFVNFNERNKLQRCKLYYLPRNE
jgi:hypothetical protein